MALTYKVEKRVSKQKTPYYVLVFTYNGKEYDNIYLPRHIQVLLEETDNKK